MCIKEPYQGERFRRVMAVLPDYFYGWKVLDVRKEEYRYCQSPEVEDMRWDDKIADLPAIAANYGSRGLQVYKGFRHAERNPFQSPSRNYTWYTGMNHSQHVEPTWENGIHLYGKREHARLLKEYLIFQDDLRDRQLTSGQVFRFGVAKKDIIAIGKDRTLRAANDVFDWQVLTFVARKVWFSPVDDEVIDYVESGGREIPSEIEREMAELLQMPASMLGNPSSTASMASMATVPKYVKYGMTKVTAE